MPKLECVDGEKRDFSQKDFNKNLVPKKTFMEKRELRMAQKAKAREKEREADAIQHEKDAKAAAEAQKERKKGGK